MSKLDDLDFDIEELELDEEDEGELDPSLQDIIDNEKLKWIFIGGKGGVGKTTISSSFALLLAKHRKDVLLISTDPAHSLSDIFMQKFGDKPTLVEGTKNLSVMEINPKKVRKLPDMVGEMIPKDFVKDMAGSFPGMDEVSTIIEIMRQVDNLDFSCVVFDTAPTGHTLRLLSFPEMMKKGYNKYFGLIKQVTSFLTIKEEELKESSNTIQEITKQFKNPELTTFVCVCIPSFLSVYETERLVQELAREEIDTTHIVVNQIIPDSEHCKFCRSRHRIQKKYIDQIHELYKGFHILEIPLFEDEIKSVDKLETLFKFYLKSK